MAQPPVRPSAPAAHRTLAAHAPKQEPRRARYAGPGGSGTSCHRAAAHGPWTCSSAHPSAAQVGSPRAGHLQEGAARIRERDVHQRGRCRAAPRGHALEALRHRLPAAERLCFPVALSGTLLSRSAGTAHAHAPIHRVPVLVRKQYSSRQSDVYKAVDLADRCELLILSNDRFEFALSLRGGAKEIKFRAQSRESFDRWTSGLARYLSMAQAYYTL